MCGQVHVPGAVGQDERLFVPDRLFPDSQRFFCPSTPLQGNYASNAPQIYSLTSDATARSETRVQVLHPAASLADLMRTVPAASDAKMQMCKTFPISHLRRAFVLRSSPNPDIKIIVLAQDALPFADCYPPPSPS